MRTSDKKHRLPERDPQWARPLCPAELAAAAGGRDGTPLPASPRPSVQLDGISTSPT